MRGLGGAGSLVLAGSGAAFRAGAGAVTFGLQFLVFVGLLYFLLELEQVRLWLLLMLTWACFSYAISGMCFGVPVYFCSTLKENVASKYCEHPQLDN